MKTTKSLWKYCSFIFVLLLIASPIWAVIDIFVEIAPSDKAKGHHNNVKFEKKQDGKLVLTLTQISDLKAWLVVCEKERGKGARDFRYEVNWSTLIAKKKDIKLVAPVAFGKGVASLKFTGDRASRSYIVFGGHFDDGTFYTVNLPAFHRAME